MVYLSENDVAVRVGGLVDLGVGNDKEDLKTPNVQRHGDGILTLKTSADSRSWDASR